MLEIAAFTGALTSLGALIKVANEGKNVEMTGKLIELQQKILGMQGDFGEMQQKLFELQQKNRELTEAAAEKSKYDYRFNVVWRKGEDGKYIGPFCPICKAESKEMPLRFWAEDSVSGKVFVTCHKYHDDGYQNKLMYSVPKEQCTTNI